MKKDKFDFRSIEEAKSAAEEDELHNAKVSEAAALIERLDAVTEAARLLHDPDTLELLQTFVDCIRSLPQEAERLDNATQLKVTDNTRDNYNRLLKTAFSNAFKDLDGDLKRVTGEYKREVHTFTSTQLKRLNEKKDCTTISEPTVWCFIILFAGLLCSFAILLFLNIFSWSIGPIYEALLCPLGISLLVVTAIKTVSYLSKKN